MRPLWAVQRCDGTVRQHSETLSHQTVLITAKRTVTSPSTSRLPLGADRPATGAWRFASCGVNWLRAGILPANVMVAGQVCGMQTRPELQSQHVTKAIVWTWTRQTILSIYCCPFQHQNFWKCFSRATVSVNQHWQITYNVRIILWVDHICVIVPNMCTEQDTCGSTDKCPECSRCKLRTWDLDAQFTKDIKVLGFETNWKDVPSTTLAFFLGLGFETLTMEFWGTPRQSTNLWDLVQRIAHTWWSHSTWNSCSGWQTHVVESRYL